MSVPLVDNPGYSEGNSRGSMDDSFLIRHIKPWSVDELYSRLAAESYCR